MISVADNRWGLGNCLPIAHAYRSEVSVPATGLWGSRDDNGTWNGVVGMVTRREAEVGVCDVSMTSDRVGVLSYSMQVATFQ
jgi:hypothetical protein